MQIAFYGAGRHIGTSANIAAVSAGLLQYYSMPAFICGGACWEKSQTKVLLTDCTNRNDADYWIEECDLLVLNLSIPCPDLEQIYYRYSLVRKNILFLIGKYFKDNPIELKQLACEYRISASRICTIPYHAGFADAYEKRRIPQFLERISKNGKSGVDLQFQTNLVYAAGAVIRFAERKGE